MDRIRSSLLLILHNRCSIVCICVRVAVEVRFGEVDEKLLDAHRDSVSGKSQQSYDHQKKVDDCEKAKWNSMPQLNSSQRTASWFLPVSIASSLEEPSEDESKRAFLGFWYDNGICRRWCRRGEGFCVGIFVLFGLFTLIDDDLTRVSSG